ncbi:MAG: hypothetical protein WCJ19_02095 [bacterium]
MNKSKFLQKEHERRICNLLLNLEKIKNIFQRYGNDKGEPDILYSINGKLIGIEVTTIYYNNEYAKFEWMTALGKEITLFNVNNINFNINYENEVYTRLRQNIKSKCSKKYIGIDESWLCLEERGPLTYYRILQHCINQIIIPRNNNFTKIFIITLGSSMFKKNYEAFRIF